MDERSLWNRKYGEKSHRSLDPDLFLPRAYQEFLSGRPAGDVLDVAGGGGRHSLLLGPRGWRATLLDIFHLGNEFAKKKASRKLAPPARGVVSIQPADFNWVS